MIFNHKTIPYTEFGTKTVKGRRCYTTPDGDVYPSVTTILGDKPKPYLEEWRQSLGPDKADKETNRCAERGTAVHLIAEQYLNNIENPSKKHTPENTKLFNQLKFRLNKINDIYAQEIPLFSDTLKIAGRVDCVGHYDGELSIIDFKTSNNNKTDEMILDYKLQCVIYALCWYEMFGELIENFVVLIAVEKGMVSQVFKGKVKDYIVEAQNRINTFYKENEDGL